MNVLEQNGYTEAWRAFGADPAAEIDPRGLRSLVRQRLGRDGHGPAQNHP